MRSIEMRSVCMAVVMGFAAVLISVTLLEVSPALAYEEKVPGALNQAPAQPPPPDDDDLLFIAFLPPCPYPCEEFATEILDLSGNVVGEGMHEGRVKCNGDNCSQNTTLDFTVPRTWYSVEYKFATRQALDPDAERAVVEGRGTISGPGQKERFTFIATFQNNRDGTLAVRYEASNPDASFIVPRSPGTFSIYTRR